MTAWYGARVNLTPSQIFDELCGIAEQLDSLQPDAAERARLELRRDTLRRQAQVVSDTGRNPDNLRRELEHLRARLSDMDAERVEVPAWQRKLTADGRLSIVNPVADAARINAAIHAATAHERAAIAVRIVRIEEMLGE